MFAVSIDLSAGLAVVYALAIVIWYELIRYAVLSLIARRRRAHVRRDEFELWRRREAEQAESSREAAGQLIAEESEPDPARRYYYLARKTARAERDAAVETANRAVRHALERIERRHREIEAALDQEETERIEAQLGRLHEDA